MNTIRSFWEIIWSFIFVNVFFLNMACTTTDPGTENIQSFTVHKIGEILKEDGRTFIVIDKAYEPGLMGLEDFSEITVVYWFDRNDTPANRSILQVHPRGDTNNPLRGVFTTHSPVRPNQIAITRCNIISVKNNIIEIDEIDAFDRSPVLDLKN